MTRGLGQATTTLAAGDFEISSDVDCGAGVDIAQIAPDHYALVVPSDPESIAVARGYDYYFCARLTNISEQSRTVLLDAMRPGSSERQPQWRQSKVPIFVSEDFASWYVLDEVLSSPDHEEYRIPVSLEARQSVFVCNSLPYPPERMAAWLKRLQALHRDRAELTSIGLSGQGREILLLTVSEPKSADRGKDRVLVTSGFHPAEADWLATTAILELLLDDRPWSKALLEGFIFDFVLQANPDGAALGKNGCNAYGINLYWDFRPTDAETSPEASHLWRWVEVHPPQLYLDLHSYVHQLFKDFRPYIRPSSDYARRARPIVRAIDRRLIALCEGRAATVPETSLPTTLAVQMTQAFGTITYAKFHTHLNHGVEACQDLGRDMFKAITDVAYANRPLAPKIAARASNRLGVRDYLLRWWEYDRTVLRMRSLRGGIARRLGISNGRANHLQPLSDESGLADHWRRHLWSQRGQAEPVAVVGGKAGIS